MTLLIGLAVKSSVLLALGLLAAASLARRSAALRHRVLAASLLAAAAVTPASLVLPEWHLPVPQLVGREPVAPSAMAVNTVHPRQEPAIEPSRVPPPARHVGLSMWERLSPVLVVWLAGVLFCAGALTLGVIRVHRTAARSTPVDDPEWRRTLHAIARRYGLTREVVLSRTDSPDLLATWGLLRPRVLVPSRACDWTLERVHVVLSHELAHIRRHDWAVQIAAEYLRTVLWFNPLAWIVCTRLRREAEQACDDEVLAAGVGGSDYAAHLLALVRQCRRRGSTWAPAMPMAHPSTFERRIAAMLNPGLERRVPSRRALAALGAGLLCVTLPLAALRAGQPAPAPLVGTVYDITGGVIPGATVTLAGPNNFTATATTNARGRFELPAVARGTYNLGVALVGFNPLRQEVALQEPTDWTRAVTLQLGELSETVHVAMARPNATAPSAGEAAGPVRVGGNIRVPRKVRHVNPAYPGSMRDAGQSGVVQLDAIIGADGRVSSVRVVSTQAHPDFVASAAEAVRQWTFTPTLLNKVPVDVIMTVTVRFDLKG